MDRNRFNINDKIVIGHWNANGLKEKFDELAQFIFERGVDIMLINETKFVDKSKCSLPGYRCIRKDRGNNIIGGGICILVRENIPCIEIDLKTRNVESIGIKLSDGLIIFSVYSPKQIDVNELSKLFDASEKVLVMGDLNAKHSEWNCMRANQSGKMLHKFLSKQTYAMIVPDRHTHYPYNSNLASTIDLAIVKNVNNCGALESLNELDSDHSPLLLELFSRDLKEECDKTFYNYKNANWKKFRNLLQSKITENYRLSNSTEIEAAVIDLTEKIQAAMRSSIPLHVNKAKNPLTAETRKMITTRNRLRKRYQSTRFRSYKVQQNRLRNKIRTAIVKSKNLSWEQRLKKLSPRDNSLWKLTKFFTKGRERTIPALHGPRGIVFTDREKANVLADQFERVHHLTEDFSDRETERMVRQEYKAVKESEIFLDEIEFIAPREVFKIIKLTKSRKAPGEDAIQNIVLKNLPRKALVQLTNILNACLRLSYYPDSWKTANILAIRKVGKDKLFPQNYRPISLLSTMSKVFERAILYRILKHEAAAKILIPEQFGFRRKHSTVHQLARLANDISEGFNKNQSTAMLLLDIEKAFDTVWHKGLIYKLRMYGFPMYIIKLIASYLKNRSLQTVVNGTKSEKQSIAAGVPQGSILGPVLFLYYLNDIPRRGDTKIAVFADDTAVYATSWRKHAAVKRIQQHIEVLEPYFDRWKIKTNADKFELVVFSHKETKTEVEPLYMNNTGIHAKKEAKYLGVVLDSKLSFTSHIKTVRKKCANAVSLLYNLLNFKSKLSIKNKLLIYKTIIRPIMLYAAPIWGNTFISNINKLETIQNKALRMVSGEGWRVSNAQIRKKLDMITVYTVIYDMTKMFYEHQLNNIPLLLNLGKYTKDTAPFKIKYKLPHHLLL